MEKQHLQQGDIVGHLHIQNRFRKRKRIITIVTVTVEQKWM